MLRDVGREHLDLDLAQRVVEHAPEVPHTVGDADQVHRHLEGDLLVGPDLVEVEVEDLARAQRVTLDLADQRLDRGAAVDGDVHDRGAGADADQHLVERRRVHGQRLRGTVVPVDHAGDFTLAAERAGGALPGEAPGGGLEVRLLGHSELLVKC